MKSLPRILIIAGSDPSGGAGLQTDIKVATNNETYSSAVVTSLTVQNTSKVSQVFTPNSDILRSQLKSLFLDIKFDAIKIGMVGGFKNIETIIEILDKYTKDVPIVLDPVMVATSGDELLDLKNIEILQQLMKRVTIITPNINEAQILAKFKICDKREVINAAKYIKNTVNCSVFVKSGHLDLGKEVVENIFLDDDDRVHEVVNKRVDVGDVHGTGCALATAITCNIAKGFDLLTSVKRANEYVYEQIKNSRRVGKGSRILTHF